MHCRALIIALFVLGPAIFADSTTAPEKCVAALSELNENAAVPLTAYRQNNTRWLHDYQSTFHTAAGNNLYLKRMAALKSGQTVMDVGSGKSIAILQLAAEKPGVQTLGINAQDLAPYWEAIDALGATTRRRPEDLFRYAGTPGFKSFHSIDGIGQRELLGIAKACAFDAPRWMTEPLADSASVPYDAMAKDLEALAKKFREWRATANFEFATGNALNQLQNRPNSADIITDVYGAFIYGADRIALLEAYYAALKPGGVAFISLGNFREYGGDVVTGGKRDTGLPSYLVGKFDAIFDFYESPDGGRFLVMEKPHDGPEQLNIPLRVTAQGHYHRNESGFVVPKLTMEEVPQR